MDTILKVKICGDFTTDAGGETRTPKGVSPPAPKAGVSANSTTPAHRPRAL